MKNKIISDLKKMFREADDYNNEQLAREDLIERITEYIYDSLFEARIEGAEEERRSIEENM